LGFVGLNFKNYDLAALHYRHLATSITRQLNDNKTIEAIALDRARGFTVSTLDPVTGGRHCSIGGNHSTEFLVTSTLASQAPPGLGRALAIPLSNYLLGSESKFSPNAISYVSLGDGSINNAHFLSALNLAKYSEHNKVKCPLVFGISDNKICISLKGTGYVDKFIEQMQGMFVRVADGRDFIDIFVKSQEVIEYSRKFKRPSIILFSNLPRRFGHAATDRQFAYYSADEIQNQINQDPLSDTVSLLVKLGIYSESELRETFQNYQAIIENAFNTADLEPKNKSRADLIATNSAPLCNVDSSSSILNRSFSYGTICNNCPSISLNN
jgi:2-oxoisovalerate dehydrogenase E1 component